MKWKKINNILPFILIALVASNIVFWLKEIWPDGNLNNKKIYLPNFQLQGFNSQKLTSDYLDAKLNIVIFFSLTDCPACLFEAEYWGKIGQMYNDTLVKIIGITNTPNSDDISMFCNEYNITFPIALDKNWQYKTEIISLDRSISKMKLHTPIKIFIDSSKKILLIKGANKNIENQGQIIGDVHDCLRIK